jgi:hypothetical protein
VSPYSFALFDLSATEPGLDVLYLADDGAGGGLKRYRKSQGAWGATAEATFGPVVRHIACTRDAADVVCVGSSSGGLFRFRDVGAAAASNATLGVSLGTAAPNTGYRGVAFAPVP